MLAKLWRPHCSRPSCRGRCRPPVARRDRRGAGDLAPDRRARGAGGRHHDRRGDRADGRGRPFAARARRALGRFANPAAAIGTWLTLAAWTGPEVRGAAVSGYCHRAELVGATLAELPDLLEPGAARRAVDQLRARDRGRPQRRPVRRRADRPRLPRAGVLQARAALTWQTGSARSIPPMPPAAMRSSPACPIGSACRRGSTNAPTPCARSPGLVCERDGRVVGFLTVVRPSAVTAEISWLAVHANDRGDGVGTKMVEGLVADLSGTGVRLLLVKTLSDREDPGPGIRGHSRVLPREGVLTCG